MPDCFSKSEVTDFLNFFKPWYERESESENH